MSNNPINPPLGQARSRVACGRTPTDALNDDLPPELYPTFGAKSPAPLTAGFLTKFLTPTLDRLTLVGDIKRRKYQIEKIPYGDKTIKMRVDATFMEWSKLLSVPAPSRAAFPYRYQFQTADGYLVQIAEKGSPCADVRIDCNPSKLTNGLETIRPLLDIMTNVRPTRIDLAIDYPCDLSSYFFDTPTPRKTIRYQGAAGQTETLYLGTPESPERYRIYDKAKEQKTEGVWWRIEQQFRLTPDDDYTQLLPFQNLTVSRPGGNIPLIDRYVLEGLQREPAGWGQLTGHLRRKYRAMVKSKDMETLTPSPFSIWFEHGEAPLNEIKYYLGHLEVN